MSRSLCLIDEKENETDDGASSVCVVSKRGQTVWVTRSVTHPFVRLDSDQRKEGTLSSQHLIPLAVAIMGSRTLGGFGAEIHSHPRPPGVLGPAGTKG